MGSNLFAVYAAVLSATNHGKRVSVKKRIPNKLSLVCRACAESNPALTVTARNHKTVQESATAHGLIVASVILVLLRGTKQIRKSASASQNIG